MSRELETRTLRNSTAVILRQDLRRGLGVGIMLILALGIWIGARIEPRVAGKANLAFVQAWLVITVLILILLAVALLDWLETRLYAAGCVDRSRETRRITAPSLRQASSDPERSRSSLGAGTRR